ncbi:MAG: glycosyltransferase [Clostridia bacterium]|nr:glycosyltransferase [Clostridia bacterium]
MKKSRIVFFSRDLKIGGMEKALVLLLNSLADLDCYNITLVLEKKEGPLLSKINNNITVREYRLSSIKNVFFRKVSNYLHRLFWTLKNYNRYSFSCNYATYSVIGSRLAQIASKNNSLYIHSDYYNVFDKNEQKMLSFFSELKARKFKHLIFVSNESKDNFINVLPNFKSKCKVINNIIDYELVKKLAYEECLYEFNPDCKNFIFIGRLDNVSKNLDLLVESFNLAYQKDKNICLYIVGNGPYKAEIEKYIRTNKLQGCIELFDETLNPYVYLKECDFLILTSNYEGFPVVYLEALVLNKKIITTVLTSDDMLSVSDYSIYINKNAQNIAETILQVDKNEKVNWNIDFKQMNENKVNKIISIVGG